MTTHVIRRCCKATASPPSSKIADHLPMFPFRLRVKTTTRPISDRRAPASIGNGWSTASPKSGIPFVGILIEHPAGVHISGVAWQSPDQEGRWFAQLQRVEAKKFDA